MHCISCEVILEKAFKNIKWLTLISINHKKWILEVEFSNNYVYNELKKHIEKNNFSIVEDYNIEKHIQSKKITLEKVLKNIILYLWISVFIYLFTLIELYKYLPDTSNLNYGGAFIMWIIASLSTCLAVTWWIIIGFSRYIDNTKWTYAHIKVQWLFQIWRILGFFILWWVLWKLWEILNIWFGFTSIFSFLIWFLFLYMWLYIIWVAPSITKFGFHLPKSFSTKIAKFQNPKYAPIIWALTFFLPCWFTQSLQVIAIGSGDFMSWAIIMAIFAVWTSPVLFSVWLGSSYFKEKKFNWLNKLIWIILIFFGIFTITNAYNLLWVPNSNKWLEILETQKQVENNLELEVIKISHNWWFTEPRKIELKAGWNYKIEITPTSNWLWCMSTLVSPKLSGIVFNVTKWKIISYEIKNAKPGKYPLVCSSMWMEQWVIIVK